MFASEVIRADVDRPLNSPFRPPYTSCWGKEPIELYPRTIWRYISSPPARNFNFRLSDFLHMPGALSVGAFVHVLALVSVMNRIPRKIVIELPWRNRNTKFTRGCFVRYGPIYQSDHFLILRPVLWFGLVYGKMPCSIKSGWMCYSYKSLPFTYAYVLTLATWTCHLYYCKQIAEGFAKTLNSSASFSSVLFLFMIVTQPFITAVMVYSWIFEIPAMVECFNRTAVLEKKLRSYYQTRSRSKWKIRIVMFCIILFIVSDFFVACFLVLRRYSQKYPLLVLLFIIIGVVSSYTFCILWCINFYFIGDFAAKLHKHMHSVGEYTPYKLNICRRVWIAIWKQSQRFSESIAVTIGFGVLINGTIFVVGCFGLIVSAGDLDIHEIIEMLPYVGISIVLIVSVIEMPHQATDKLGNTFLKSMVSMKRDMTDSRCIKEIDKFNRTIKQSLNARITLKDYVTMDRSLIISFLSYSVTYLIILLQLRNKNDEPFFSSSTASTQNNTELEYEAIQHKD